VDPIFFLLGRMEEFPGSIHLPDAGSINHLGRTIGDSNFAEVECNPKRITREFNFPGVTSVTLDGFKPPRNRRSILTEGPDIGEIQDLVVTNQPAVQPFMEWLFENQASQTDSSEVPVFQESLVQGQILQRSSIRPPSDAGDYSP
jgi:hypothetical protein